MDGTRPVRARPVEWLFLFAFRLFSGFFSGLFGGFRRLFGGFGGFFSCFFGLVLPFAGADEDGKKECRSDGKEGMDCFHHIVGFLYFGWGWGWVRRRKIAEWAQAIEIT